MKLRNRLLSLLLATSMVVGSVQMTSLAQEDTTKTELSISSVETEDENPDDQNRGGVEDTTTLENESSSDDLPNEDMPVSEDEQETYLAVEEDEPTSIEDDSNDGPMMWNSSGTLSVGRYSIFVKLTEDWVQAITGVSIDGDYLKEDEYEIVPRYVDSDGLLAGELQFTWDGFLKQTSREKVYDVTIHNKKYGSLTAKFTMISYAASTFTIRVLDENGNVMQSKVFTLDEMEKMATEQRYIIYQPGLTDYRVYGVTLDTLFNAANIKVEDDAVLCFRANNNKSEINDDPDATYYEDQVTYKEYMAKRYTIANIYEPEWLEQFVNTAYSYNAADAMRELLLKAEKKVVEPMISINYASQSIWSDSTESALDSINLEKKIRTFGFFSGMNIGENEDSSSIEFRNYIQENAYGIDIVKSTKPALQDETFRLYHAYGDVYAYYMKMENVDYTWLRSITSISLDTQLLSKDQYKIERSSITNNRLYIKESVFDQQNVRTKTYQVRIVADGYEDVTANLTVTIDRATDFTIRVLDANGAVQQTKTFTMDEMISMSKEVEQYYVVAKQWVSKAYSVTGVTLSTLLEKSGISFREGQTIKFRTNEYAIDNNLAQNANAYEKSVTYEELMKSRYSFTDLSKNPLNDWEWITQFQNYTRIEVEPIFALKWAEGNLTQYIQPNINFGTSIEGRQFTFFAGIEFEVDEDGNEYAIRNESYMLDTVFGIDIVDTNLSLNVIPVVKDSYVYDGKAVEVSYEVKDSQGNVITDTSIYGLKLQSYYREASIEQWIEGLPVNVGTYEVQYRVVSYQSTEDIVFTSETSIINIKNKTVTEVDKPEDDKSEVDKPTVEDPLVPITGTTVKGDITIASVRQSMMNAAVIKMNELIANDMSKVLEELAEKLTSAEQREAYAQLQAALEDDTREITPELYTIVDLKPTGNPDANGDYWVTLSNEKIEKDTMIVVLHYKEAEEEWETIVPEEVTDGQIIFKTKSFSPFAVVGVGATEGTGNSSDSDGIQTGDDTSKVQIAMWLMLVLSAGTAAVVARRKRRVE